MNNIEEFDYFKNNKLFEDDDEYESQNDFLTRKDYLIEKLDEFIEYYDEFAKEVAPKHWRRTGNHYAELKKMRKEVGEFEEISDGDLKLDWVKKELER